MGPSVAAAGAGPRPWFSSSNFHVRRESGGIILPLQRGAAGRETVRCGPRRDHRMRRMTMTIRAAIIGPTGYTAYETIQILRRHPSATITALASRREEAPAIDEVFPALSGLVSLKCETLTAEQVAERCDVA